VGPPKNSVCVDVVSCSIAFCCGGFSYYSLDGVRLSPLGTPGTLAPLVSASSDHDRCAWSSWRNENWQRNPSTRIKRTIVPLFSSTNLTWHDLGSKPGRSGGMLVTSRLRYGTASWRGCVTQSGWSLVFSWWGYVAKNPRWVREGDVKEEEVGRFGLNWLRTVTSALCSPVLML
jgi:hypothetical protein